ncbi:hypothetical protein [Meiothermus granaticius]|uniref:SprT-like family protein n=1 Tax=Meiothermus granaticius NBRC 107808 TaxID=1227551 RepID=A0A399FCL8_9DEIN|nr:hypothetical protein [Meiothermus granaticius]RIH93998.1 hypothetical protein Mgrana_00084 [Meiothermus granaticius NBRC 107808]GEM88173.1 hypothetical protein MGR01S_27980 [Meiothermus granaticius NBRC 107808]
MHFPATLEILGKTWTVEILPESRLNARREVGEIVYTHTSIAVEDGQSEEQAIDTLLHEAIHAIDYTMAIGLEERQVHALSSGLYALLKQNPALLALFNRPEDEHGG